MRRQVTYHSPVNFTNMNFKILFIRTIMKRERCGILQYTLHLSTQNLLGRYVNFDLRIEIYFFELKHIENINNYKKNICKSKLKWKTLSYTFSKIFVKNNIISELNPNFNSL